jgi:16S rRNA (guanine966-N2)-methyltransferase
MRVIAGKRGHLKLASPEGMGTRPTTDRIKETLFNIIQYDCIDAEFLDLFAGSGQIGIEALSRGAKHATFIEKDKKAASIIKQNLHTTKLEDESTLLNQNVFDALRGFPKGKRFDIIFMDPPYQGGLEETCLKMLLEYELCDENTIVIVEADKHFDTDFIENVGFRIDRQKIYKTNQHLFLRKKA